MASHTAQSHTNRTGQMGTPEKHTASPGVKPESSQNCPQPSFQLSPHTERTEQAWAKLLPRELMDQTASPRTEAFPEVE